MTHNEQLAINSAITEIAEQHNTLCDTIYNDTLCSITHTDIKITSIHVYINKSNIIAKASVKISLVACKPIVQSTPNSGPI